MEQRDIFLAGDAYKDMNSEDKKVADQAVEQRKESNVLARNAIGLLKAIRNALVVAIIGAIGVAVSDHFALHAIVETVNKNQDDIAKLSRMSEQHEYWIIAYQRAHP